MVLFNHFIIVKLLYKYHAHLLQLPSISPQLKSLHK